MRLVGFFLDIGGCVINDQAEIHYPYCRVPAIQMVKIGVAVAAKPELRRPVYYEFVQQTELFQVVDMQMD